MLSPVGEASALNTEAATEPTGAVATAAVSVPESAAAVAVKPKVAVVVAAVPTIVVFEVEESDAV